MRWYAGQVDVAQIKQKSEEAMTRQAVDEMLREGTIPKVPSRRR
jgi:hypothetical protein